MFLLLAQTNFNTKLAMTDDELNAFVGDMNDLHETGGEYTTVGYIDGRYAKAVFVATNNEQGTTLTKLDGVQDFVAIDLERERIGVRIGNQLGEMSLANFTRAILENTPIDFGDTPTIEVPEGAKLATYIDSDGTILLAYQIGKQKVVVRMGDGGFVLEALAIKDDVMVTADNVFVFPTLEDGRRTSRYTAVTLDSQSGEMTVKTDLPRDSVFEDVAAAK